MFIHDHAMATLVMMHDQGAQFAPFLGVLKNLTG